MIVSTHAVVRYFERVLGVDTDELKERIQDRSPRAVIINDHILLDGIAQEYGPMVVESARSHLSEICEAAAVTGALCMTRDGVSYVFKNGAPLTVMPQEMRRWRQPRPGVAR